MTAAYLGIDIGTSSCKALLMAPSGEVVGVETSSYPSLQPQEGWSEQCPADWITGARNAISALLANTSAEILAIGLSGQMHGMVALDKQYRVMRPAILWNDQRNEVECEEITVLAGGLAALIKMVNNRMYPGFTGGKIRWFQKNEPQLYERTRIILNPKDYVRYCLTGEIATEVSDASGTGVFDVANRCWSGALLEKIDIDKTLLPPCFESQIVSAEVSTEGASLFGLTAGTPVVGGGGDAVIQTFGSGVVDNAARQTTIGTAGIVATASEYPLANVDGHIQVSCNVVPGRWHLMGVSLNAGSVLSWWRDILHQTGGHNLSFDDMAASAQQAPIGSGGLIFLPYLMGERCPWSDASARGALLGLRSHHDIGHLSRAIFESVILSLRDIALAMEDTTINNARIIHTSGGGASSDFWNQMQADLFATDVMITRHASHGGAYGAAMLAAIGNGHWGSFEDAAKVCQVERCWRPRQNAVQSYNALFSIYQPLYHHLRHLNKQLSTYSAGHTQTGQPS